MLNVIDFLLEHGGKPIDATWDEVGEVYGISGNAARKRWYRHRLDHVEREMLTETAQMETPAHESVYSSKDRPVTPTTEAKVEAVEQAGEFAGWNVPPPPPGFRYTKIWGTQDDPRTSMERVADEESETTIAEQLERIIAERISPVDFTPPVPINDTNEVYVLATADKHVGAKISEESIYEDLCYDADVFRKRMDFLADEVILAAGQRSGFDKFVCFDLGDGVDGFNQSTTRGGHQLPQNMTSIEQYSTYVNVHLDFFEKLILAGAARNYLFLGASNSNHGGDHDFICMDTVGRILATKYPDIFDYHISAKFIDSINLTVGEINYGYLYCHGKDKRDRKRGLPLKLDDKTTLYLDGLYDYYGYSRTDSVSVLKGDLHQGGVEWTNKWEYINVPSVFGSSDWVINNFGYTRPGAYYEVLTARGKTQGFINLPV